MTRSSTRLTATLTGMALLAFAATPSGAQQSSGSAQTANTDKQTTEQAGQPENYGALQTKALEAINWFKQKDPSLKTFFQNSAGYAVFPTVGEGALIIGGAHGQGVLYQNGQPVGQTTVTKGTVGAQAGGESYSEVIFFENAQALQRFKQGNFEFSAGASAVIADAGVGKATNYRDGVAVFTTSRTGLMAKAAIGGQKFTYQPVEMGAGGLSGQSGTSSGVGSSSLGTSTNANSPRQ